MKRSSSFIVIFLVYLLAFGVGYVTFKQLSIESFTMKMIFADIAATVVVWLFGVVFKNSSVYDPYWSVAPMVIVPFFVRVLDLKSVLILVAIFFWGLRLTLNWAYTFQGMKYQDWRYTHYKNLFPRIWPLVNFFGINMFPTMVVIFAMFPSFLYLESSYSTVTFLTLAGFALCIISVCIQYISDKQMHEFKKAYPGKVNNTGLWRYSRHPNYLGEICMWWGVFLMMLSVYPFNIMLIICPLINTLMFIFISIPLMENRQIKNKPEYKIYINHTSRLFFWPPKNNAILEENE